MIGDKKTPLSSPVALKTRTDFSRKRMFGGMNLNTEERRLYDFVYSNRADVGVYFQCKTSAFLKKWLEKSINEYKDALVAANKTDMNQDEIRGIIVGQYEIYKMFELIEKIQNSKQEEKKK